MICIAGNWLGHDSNISQGFAIYLLMKVQCSFANGNCTVFVVTWHSVSHLWCSICKPLTSNRCTSTDTEVIVSPLRPLAVVGTDVQLNCTLVGFPENVTSASIQFVPPRPENDGGQLVEIVDRHTAKLLYPAVQRKDSYGNVFCKVIGHEQYGQVSLRVAGKLSQTSSCTAYPISRPIYLNVYADIFAVNYQCPEISADWEMSYKSLLR